MNGKCGKAGHDQKSITKNSHQRHRGSAKGGRALSYSQMRQTGVHVRRRGWASWWRSGSQWMGAAPPAACPQPAWSGPSLAGPARRLAGKKEGGGGTSPSRTRGGGGRPPGLTGTSYRTGARISGDKVSDHTRGRGDQEATAAEGEGGERMAKKNSRRLPHGQRRRAQPSACGKAPGKGARGVWRRAQQRATRSSGGHVPWSPMVKTNGSGRPSRLWSLVESSTIPL